MQRSLSFATLGELDGGAARAIIEAAIREAMTDLDDRGQDGLPRRVDVRLTVKQMPNGLVEAHVEATASVPKRRTNSTICRLKRSSDRSARLLFQDGAPDDPDQRTLDEASPQSFPTPDEE